MDRIYTGILWFIAFAIAVLRGIHGGSIDSTLPGVCLAIFIFSIAGFIMGWLVGWIEKNSVLTTVAGEVSLLGQTSTLEG